MITSLALMLISRSMPPFEPGNLTKLQGYKVDLKRGAPLTWAGLSNSIKGNYWDVREAELSDSAAGTTISNQFVLSASPTGAILINFGSLDLALGPNARIRKATLVLTSAEGEPAPVQSVSIVKGEWLMPQVASLGLRKPIPDPKKKPTETTPAEPIFGANWKSRDGVGTPWKNGSFGSADLESVTTKSTIKENVIRIEGLETALQSIHDRWWENTGLALKFGKQVNFWSSLSKFYKPTLEIEYDSPWLDIANPRITGVTVEGSQVKVSVDSLLKPGSIEWRPARGKNESVAIDSGSATFTIPAAAESRQTKLAGHFVLVTDQPDAIPSDNAIEFYPGATNVNLVNPADARWWNQNVSRQSRFSFAPNGALGYVNPIVPPDNVRVGDPVWAFGSVFKISPITKPIDSVWRDRFPGIFGYGESRTDVQLLPGMALPATPEFNPLLDDLQLERNGELSATDVAIINQPKVVLPAAILARLTDTSNRPLSKVAVKFIGFNEAISLDKINDSSSGTEVTSGPTGVVSIPQIAGDVSDPNFAQRGFAIEAKIADSVFGDRIARRVLKGWQIVDLGSRGSGQATVIDLKFAIARTPINESTNLALGKLVSDSAGSFPAQLVGLVDGNPATTYDFPAAKKSWVEIDLGRDRVVGAIQIDAASMPESFQIMVRNTGDKLEDAVRWASEPEFSWTKQFQSTFRAVSNGKPVIYFSDPIQVRYIRIVSLSGGLGKISGISLFSRQQAQQ